MNIKHSRTTCKTSMFVVLQKSDISKFPAPALGLPGPHTFLHRIKTFGVEIRPVFKRFMFHKVENVKS